MEGSFSAETTTGGGGVLETSKAERAVWLMKCPGLVSRFLSTPPPSTTSYEACRPVAKVILSIDPLAPVDDENNNNSSSSTQFTMELADTESGDVLKSYSMDMSKDLIPMTVFAESSQGKVTVEGKILNKFDLRLHDKDLEKYGKLCRQRTNKYMTKTRQIQVISNDNGSHMRPMPGMVEPVPADKRKGAETKRTRRDRNDMDYLMFKLFERQPNWTLRQLIQETDQPEQFLKKILKELCVYNNKGANQGSYELKLEYRKSDADKDPE